MAKFDFRNPLRAKLKSGETAFGLWVTLESATISEIAAEMGIDWICIDMEHGSLSYRDAVQHARAAKGSGMAVLARVPATSVDTVKRCLDLGLDGVLLPLVNNADALREGFKHARYPRLGARGIGGERAVRWGLQMNEYLARANEETMVIPLIETAQAAANINHILAVEGLEAIFFGPADLSASLGHLGTWEGPGVAEEILRINKLAAEHGIGAGVVGISTEDSLLRMKQGFRMIGLGSDAGMMIRQMKSLLGSLKGETFGPGWF
jgi:2-keto-3-deoxy-L-rhamnonate aldolase RhmA